MSYRHNFLVSFFFYSFTFLDVVLVSLVIHLATKVIKYYYTFAKCRFLYLCLLFTLEGCLSYNAKIFVLQGAFVFLIH